MTAADLHRALPSRAPGRLLRACGAWAVLALFGAARAAGAGAPAARVSVELRPEVEVRGAQVWLGDVAILETDDLAALERLIAVPLGPAPRSGTVMRLERGPLLRWIRAQTGIPADQVSWRGPEGSSIRLALAEVSGGEVAARAAAALSSAVERAGWRPLLTPVQIPRDVSVPAGVVELAARSIPRAAVTSPRPTVWVDVRVDGRFVRTVPVVFELALLDAQNASAVAPRAGADPAPANPAERTLAVRRGGRATLRTVQGRIALERRVEVLEDGREGQNVRVRLGASQVLTARVAGPESLEVLP